MSALAQGPDGMIYWKIGEIGMNAYAYGIGPAHDGKWLMVDLGLTFPRDSEPGVDVVLFGTSSIGHLKSNIASILRPPLPEADRAETHDEEVGTIASNRSIP